MEQQVRVGFAFCGSFCTFSPALKALERVHARYGDVTPIVSESSASTDTRFGAARGFMTEMERICGKPVIDSIAKVEPIGPKGLLDVLVTMVPTVTPVMAPAAAWLASAPWPTSQ